MPFLIKYWRPLTISAFVAIIFLFGYYAGYSNQKRAYDAYKSQIEAKSAEIDKHNAELLVKQKQITDDVAKGYADAVKKIIYYYRNNPSIKWVHNGSTIPKGVSEVSDTTKQPDGKAKGNQIDTTGVNPIDCASDVLQLLYLQKWIKTQSLVQ